jgi:hypothetical protein
VLLVQAVQENISPLKREYTVYNVQSEETSVKKERHQSFSALKVINKNALHSDEVKVIRGEAKILQMLLNEPNIV